LKQPNSDNHCKAPYLMCATRVGIEPRSCDHDYGRCKNGTLTFSFHTASS